jgi:hypothetical protein
MNYVFHIAVMRLIMLLGVPQLISIKALDDSIENSGGGISDVVLCINTSRGCVMTNPHTYPYGTILYHFKDPLPDQTNTITMLAHDRHVLLIGPPTPYLPLVLSQMNLRSLTVLHHLRKQVDHIRQTCAAHRIEPRTIQAFLSYSDSEVAHVPVKESFSLLDYYSRHLPVQDTGDVPSISIARATQGRAPLLLVVQDAPNMTHAVEVAVSACRADSEAVAVVAMPYDLEGAVLAAEQLQSLLLLARLDPAAIHLHPGPHPAPAAGRACFWHASDLFRPGLVREGAAGGAERGGLGALGPWVDVVCLPPALAPLAPPDTRCPRSMRSCDAPSTVLQLSAARTRAPDSAARARRIWRARTAKADRMRQRMRPGRPQRIAARKPASAVLAGLRAAWGRRTRPNRTRVPEYALGESNGWGMGGASAERS